MEVLHLSAIYSPSEGARGWSLINTQYETPAREHTASVNFLRVKYKSLLGYRYRMLKFTIKSQVSLLLYIRKNH